MTNPELADQEVSASVIAVTSQHRREASGSTSDLNSGDVPPKLSLPPGTSVQRTVGSPVQGGLPEPSSNLHPSDARASLQSSNDRATWELVIEMMEKRHENEVADLNEEHKIEIDERDKKIHRLEGQIKRARTKNERTQMQVNDLREGQTKLKSQVDASHQALQQATAVSEALQAQYDELKDKSEITITTSDQPQSPHGQQEITAEATNQEGGVSEDEMGQFRQAYLAIAADLNQALADNHRLFAEAYDLKQALEKDPDRDPGVQMLIGHKDQALRDLHATAWQCSIELRKLQKESSENIKLAKKEIKRLRTQVLDKNRSVACLHSSMSEYKEVSESILAMLKGRVYPNDLIQGMEDYYQAALKDNRILSTGSMKQSDQIDELYETLGSLRADFLQTKRSLDEKDDLYDQIQRDMREKENELGVVQMKLECLEHDHAKAVDEKDREIAEANRLMVRVEENVSQMINGSLDDCQLHFLLLKAEEKQRAVTRCQEAMNEIGELRQRLQDRESQDALNTCLQYFNDQKYQQDAARLRKIEEELRSVHDEMQLLRRLPQDINLTQVLKEREELEAARKRIHALEADLRKVNCKTNNAAHAKAVDSILKLKGFCSQLLVMISRFGRAAKARGEGDYHDELEAFITGSEAYVKELYQGDEDESEVSEQGKQGGLKEPKKPEESAKVKSATRPLGQDEQPLMSSKKAVKQPAPRIPPLTAEELIAQKKAACGIHLHNNNGEKPAVIDIPAQPTDVPVISLKETEKPTKEMCDSAEGDTEEGQNPEDSMSLTPSQWAHKYASKSGESRL